VAESLGLDAPLVCNSGALVKDPFDGRTLWRAGLEREAVREVLDHFRRRDEPAISFVDHADGDPIDFLVAAHPTGSALFDEYVGLNRTHAGIDPGWIDELGSVEDGQTAHFHLCAVGTRTGMLEFEGSLLAEFAGRVRTFVQKSPRYTGTMCEVLSPAASKWSAVLHLADRWGIGPGEICAVGDDMNDVPMIQGAGLGVAMGHAPPEVLAVADHVTGDHDSDGVARLVDEVLLA
jgi:hydroxymethylpyrimidine pyrophosphatase-like HAD family hydrolase